MKKLIIVWVILTALIAWQTTAYYDASTPKVYYHVDHPEDKNITKFINIAYQISDGDLDFMAMIEGESWRDPYIQSSCITEKGTRETSYWLCQMNSIWHSEVIDDPRFYEEIDRQIEQCYKKRKGGTKFYGYKPQHKSKFLKF